MIGGVNLNADIFSGVADTVKGLAGDNPAAAGGMLAPQLMIGGLQQFANYDSQMKANKTMSDMAMAERDFQENMSNTAWQRGVKDKMAAGINPIYGTSEASTPSYKTPALTAPTIQMPDIMTMGISLAQLEQAQQKIDIDKANSAALISKSLSEEELNRVQSQIGKAGWLGRIGGTDAVSALKQVLGGMLEQVKQPNKYFNKLYTSPDNKHERVMPGEFGP